MNGKRKMKRGRKMNLREKAKQSIGNDIGSDDELFSSDDEEHSNSDINDDI